MADHDRSAATTEPEQPAMPAVPADDLYRGSPCLLVESGIRHSIGWQVHRKSGPSFVVVRQTRSGRSKILERAPLTEQGWAHAWRTLAGLDADAAAAVADRVTRLAARRDAATALADLDARSIAHLRYVTYNGGSGDVQLVKGTIYDVRFLADRLAVYPSRSALSLTELPYPTVETVEISGSDRSGSPEQLALITLGLALTGAVLGLLIYRVLGLVLGTLLFGLIGLAIGSAATKIRTTVRIRGRDAEMYFVLADKPPDVARIELSEPIRIIDSGRPGPAGDVSDPGDPKPPAPAESIPDQLSKLASLLQEGLITRAEFEGLKADLIAKPVGLDKKPGPGA